MPKLWTKKMLNRAKKGIEEPKFSIVLFNSGENFNAVIKNWDRLIEEPKFSIIFVNPFSPLEKKWIVFPYTHSRICDEKSLIQLKKFIFKY